MTTPLTADADADPVAELTIAAAEGLWAIRSASRTVYWIDCDRMAVLRQPGAGSSTGPGSGMWSPLLSVECDDGTVGTVRVGHLHRWTLGGGVWWRSRRVTGIEPAAATADEPVEDPEAGRGPFAFHADTEVEAVALAAALCAAGGQPETAMVTFADGTTRTLGDPSATAGE